MQVSSARSLCKRTNRHELNLVSAEDGPETFAASRGIDSTGLSTAYAGLWETRLVGRGLDTEGPSVTISGKVRIGNWDRNRNLRAIKAPVRLQLRTPDGHYRTIKRLTSGDHGDPKTTVTANRDRCFRFVFDPWSPEQDRWIKTRSRGDCVDVR